VKALGGSSPLARTALACLLVGGGATAAASTPKWRTAAPLPVARTEVAAARLGNELVVTGGFLANGDSTARVDAYAPRTNRWRRLPDLPAAVNHATAASADGRLYVAGGYGAERRLFVFARGRWRELANLPAPRAAAGAAIVRGKLYVVGGVVRSGVLAKRMLVFDLRRRRWSFGPGPTAREHLAATSLGGTVYAIAGRSAGRNFDYFEGYAVGRGRWTRLAPIPDPRGGTGAAVVGDRIVSVGGEEAAGTISPVYAYSVDRKRWARLPDMRTPRHGLGVVSYSGRVYAIGGGPQPGLHVSAANEFLPLG
jgi:N-acetylneuraminic acid mutarotase